MKAGLTNQQTWCFLWHGGVIADPLVEDTEDEKSKHAEQEDEGWDEFADNVERLVEIPADKRQLVSHN